MTWFYMLLFSWLFFAFGFFVAALMVTARGTRADVARSEREGD